MKHPKVSSVRLLSTWGRLSNIPMGPWIFSKLLGWQVPYSGSLGAIVVRYEPGHCTVRLKESARIRNHLGSIHAAALMNLSELASGLAFLSHLPHDMRAIVTQFLVQYHKKARGTLTAQSTFQNLIKCSEESYQVDAIVTDANGEVVCEARATWRVRPETSGP